MIVSHPALCLRATLLLLLPQHAHQTHGPRPAQPRHPRPYGGQHSLGRHAPRHHGRHARTDDGTRVHSMAVVVAGGYFTLFHNYFTLCIFPFLKLKLKLSL